MTKQNKLHQCKVRYEKMLKRMNKSYRRRLNQVKFYKEAEVTHER